MGHIPVWDDLVRALARRPGVVKAAIQSESKWDVLDLEELEVPDFPSSGAVLDLDDKRISLWSDLPDMRVGPSVQHRWVDFRVTWYSEEYEFQLEAASGTLVFPTRSPQDIDRWLRAELCEYPYAGGPVEERERILDSLGLTG